MFVSINQRLMKLFRRVTSSGDFIAEIDGLRFVALAGVLTVHIYANYLRLVPAGELLGTFQKHGLIDTALSTAGRGVELFFIISGFILALPFVMHYLYGGRDVPLGKYFKRRITRLEPPYIVVMVMFFLLRAIPIHPAFAVEKGTPNLFGSLLASLGYIHNIVYSHNSYVNGVAWSLEVEVQFYILAPLFAWVILTRSLHSRIAVYAFVFFAAPTLQHLMEVYWDYPVESSRKSILGTVQFFMMGFVLAELHAAKTICRLSGFVSIPLGILLFSAMFLIPIRESFFGSRILFLAVATVFYWLVLSPGFWQRLFRSTPLVLIGGMCYTVYLLHFPLMLIFSRFVGRVFVTNYFLPNLMLHYVLVSIPILVCSAVFFLLVEKPCMRPDWPVTLGNYFRSFALTSRSGNSPSDASSR